MFPRLSLYFKVVAAGASLYLITAALSQETDRNAGFRDSLQRYIESHEKTEPARIYVEPTAPPVEAGEPEVEPLVYRKGDWEKYIIAPRYRVLTEDGRYDEFRIEEQDEVDINSYGSSKLNLNYGKSRFTSSRYKQFDQDRPVSRVIASGYSPEHETQLHVEGRIGQRFTVYVDHDSDRPDNVYRMQYRAVRDDEVIREINAGQIDIKMNNSKYAVYDDTDTKGMGMDVSLRKGNFQLKAFGSVTRGETEVEYFRGNSSAGNITLKEYQYVRGTYFQLEPYRRYDNLSAPPGDPFATVAMTSNPPGDPQSYLPYPVNIDPYGFDLYLDDQNPLNNLNAIELSIDGGGYTRMVSGSDYTINFSTGTISLLRPIPHNSRIFAVYTIGGGAGTSDPAALVPGDPKHPGGQFAGKIFVFLKYGYAIQEDAGDDRNNDGKRNFDVYEIRSVYYIGQRQVLQENFRLRFFGNNQLLTRGETEKLGKYTVDYSRGTVSFHLREPFKQVLPGPPNTIKSLVYAENQSVLAADRTVYDMRVDYYREARSFQLKHFNIIPDSVRIKIDGREIARSLYTIDHTSGYLSFSNPNNPLIGSETNIEIKYEYMPFAAESQSFIGGLRSDYRLSRELGIGGTFLFTRSAGGEVIPVVGSEPSQTMVFEGDASLALSEGRIKDMLNAVPGVSIDSVPFDIRAYAEYARSYKNINTFGKGLIDDMESSEEITGISLSDRDWILSSMPDSTPQNRRGRLYYKYYRDPSNAGSLKGAGFTPYAIPYDRKPGPYNIATGHVDNSVRELESQRSLVMEFEFAGAETHAPMVTRRLSSEAVDFSGLQYMEIWYRGEALSGQVELYIDLGRIDEDSDGDGLLGTEDLNHNGFLDFDPSAGIQEDRGYRFNPAGGYETWIGSGPRLGDSTLGDGVLNTEDLNGNGVLDRYESYVRLPGAAAQGGPIQVEVGSGDWRMARVYLSRNSLTQDQLEVLKQVEAVRLFVLSSGPATGKIYIDSLRFVSSRWRNVKIDGVPEEDPSRFKITMVDTQNDSEYRQNAFAFLRSDIYQSLHGDRSDRELNAEIETALQIDYNLTGNGSVTRKFSKQMDLRFYKKLNMWINARSAGPADIIRVRIGSSENDYHEYAFPNGVTGVWREMEFNLRNGAGGINKTLTEGNPDLKRISYMEVIVESAGAGRLWINDIYASDPDTLSDSAHWYEVEIRGKRPLFRTGSGVPVLSDLYIKYIEKGHGAQFSTVGKTATDLMEKHRQLFTSANILPEWRLRFDLGQEKSETDSFNTGVAENKRGSAERRSMYIESDYAPTASSAPKIKLAYKNDSYENRRDEDMAVGGDVYRVRNLVRTRAHNPMLLVRNDIPDFFGGKLATSLQMDISFKKETVVRNAEGLDAPTLESYLPPHEIEKRQKGATELVLDYQLGRFFLRPTIQTATHEIVELKGKSGLSDTEVLGDVRGDFHPPFIHTGDYKFVERNNKTTLTAGLRRFWIFSPSIRAEFQYFENRFRDYQDAERLLSGPFSRSKDARGYVSNGFTMPVDFANIPALSFIRGCNLTYARSLLLQETAIPYEGEGVGAFREEYGINRAFDGLAGAGFDMAKYPPWRFFMGRGNFSNGRDFAYRRLNRKIVFPGGQEAGNYTNSLKLVDSYSFNTTMDLDKVLVTGGGNLSQVSERRAVEGVPQQVVTLGANTNVNFDLMRIFSFGFFRPNALGLPYHAATFFIGYDYGRNMLITYNIEENVHTPKMGVTFKRERSSLGLRAGVDYRHRARKEYIAYDDDRRDFRDDVYFANMAVSPPFKEVDIGYSFSAMYETDITWLYNAFSSLYRLVAFPIFSIEYSLLLNRYDYTRTVSPEPYDQHLITAKLTLDLHKNVQGGLTARWALERFRNRQTEGVAREIMSYQFGLNFTLVF
ncbi:MAG TPA: hypothetical protein PLZ78_03350 [Spirochaetota bacterium]|nr:hypothetical protein [Spirochaetota bacterium]